MKIKEVLQLKEFKYRELVTIGPGETVARAVEKLVKYDLGSLPALDEGGGMVGIITERDILRKCFAADCKLTETLVKDVMTTHVAIGGPDDDVDYAIDTMRQKRIRHLPILDGEKLVGVISMSDLLGFQYEETKAKIRYASLMPRRTHLGGTTEL